MRKHRRLANLWTKNADEWRDVAQVCSQWRDAAEIDPELIESRATKDWWATIERLGITLFVTREYEHFVLALTVFEGRPRITCFPVPHPSGLVADRKANRVYLASTRNPNQIFEFRPLSSLMARGDVALPEDAGSPMMPVASDYYPGSLYIHDLAMIGKNLYANAAGHNAVIRFSEDHRFKPVWWPKCVEVNGKLAADKNYIQLNSIASGATLGQSFFSASSDTIGRLRPGHLNYPIDRRGVIFSAMTREPVCVGLTRPHSARLRNKEIWVDNSGYGELGIVEKKALQIVRKLPGWTRGLCIVGDIAFAGTSRVIPKFARYAPGIDPRTSVCAVHAISCKTGGLLGSLEWPLGNQIFSIDWIDSRVSTGFPFAAPHRNSKRERLLFYSFLTEKA